MSYLKTRFTHCPVCDRYLDGLPIETGGCCELVVVCDSCGTHTAIVTTEEVLA